MKAFNILYKTYPFCKTCCSGCSGLLLPSNDMHIQNPFISHTNKKATETKPKPWMITPNNG